MSESDGFGRSTSDDFMNVFNNASPSPSAPQELPTARGGYVNSMPPSYSLPSMQYGYGGSGYPMPPYMYPPHLSSYPPPIGGALRGPLPPAMMPPGLMGYGLPPMAMTSLPSAFPAVGGGMDASSAFRDPFEISETFLPSELYDFFLEADFPTSGLVSDAPVEAYESRDAGGRAAASSAPEAHKDGGDEEEHDDDDDDADFDHDEKLGAKRKRAKRKTATAARKSMASLEDEVVALGSGGSGKKRAGRSKELNREHAKKARLRKKFFLDGLKDRIKTMEDENRLMRRVIEDRTSIPYADFIRFAKGTAPGGAASSRLPADEMFEDFVPKDNFSKGSLNLLQHLQKANQNFTITNPHLPDNPIIYASVGFYEMCGYDRSEVLGRNCRFLQGQRTDRKAVLGLKECIENGRKKGVCLLNYKKDGTPFWNYVFISPLTNAGGKIIMFIGVQCVLHSEDATSIIDAAADIAAECVNAPNPSKATEAFIKQLKLDERGMIISDKPLAATSAPAPHGKASIR